VRFSFSSSGAHEAAGILGVFDQLGAKVVGLEIVIGTEEWDNPQSGRERGWRRR